MPEIVVLGAGGVGVAVAASILHARLASRMTLVDADAGKAEGNAMDFAHAAPCWARSPSTRFPSSRSRGETSASSPPA